jgi:hypothetical protein
MRLSWSRQTSPNSVLALVRNKRKTLDSTRHTRRGQGTKDTMKTQSFLAALLLAQLSVVAGTPTPIILNNGNVGDPAVNPPPIEDVIPENAPVEDLFHNPIIDPLPTPVRNRFGHTFQPIRELLKQSPVQGDGTDRANNLAVSILLLLATRVVETGLMRDLQIGFCEQYECTELNPDYIQIASTTGSSPKPKLGEGDVEGFEGEQSPKKKDKEKEKEEKEERKAKKKEEKEERKVEKKEERETRESEKEKKGKTDVDEGEMESSGAIMQSSERDKRPQIVVAKLSITTG